jgi:hypothetical protein
MNLGKTISHHTMRTAQLIACAAIVAPMIGSILPQSALAQAGSTFDYTAATFSEAARQGTVDATSIRWQCRGSRCTVSGPWPQPGVMACRALAQQVGRIKSYGHSGASLNASQLAECNDGAASPVVSNKNVVVQPSQKNLPHVGATQESIQTLNSGSTLVRQKRHIERNEAFETINHASEQRQNLTLDHRHTVDGCPEIGELLVLISDLPV